MKSKLTPTTKHALTLRPRLTLSSLKENERIERFMSGEEDLNTFIEAYPMDFYKLLRNHADFADWFDKELALDVETVKMMTSIEVDNILELAKLSPKGFVSMVLSSKKSYFNFMNKDSMIFFRVARHVFPDITAEYYIAKKIEKIANLWRGDNSHAFDGDDFKDGGANTYRTPTDKEFTMWGKEESIPALGTYFIIDKSFIDEGVLRKCREDKVARRKIHDLFRMVYPLVLPHVEYLYAWDVLLLVRVWMIDRIITMLDSLKTPLELKERNKKLSSYFQLVKTSNEKNGVLSLEMSVVWHQLKNRFTFGDSVSMQNPYIAEITKDRLNNTSFSWPLGDNTPVMDGTIVVVGPSLLLVKHDYDDYDENNSFRQMKGGKVERNETVKSRQQLKVNYDRDLTINEKFRRIQDLESLLDFYVREIDFLTTIQDAVKAAKLRKKEFASMSHKEMTMEKRIELTTLGYDLEILQSVEIYYKSWISDVERDMARHDRDEMFVGSNLVLELNMNDLFSKPTQCPFLEVFFPNNNPNDDSSNPVLMQVEEGKGDNWEPYKECNRWLNYLSKRVAYMDKTPEAGFYQFGQGLSKSSSSSSLLTCHICKNETNQEEPNFNIPLCTKQCQMAWYESKGILDCFM
jgi:hypothetical protein